MPDREMVIKGLERVYEYIKSSNLHPSGSEKAMAMNSVKYAITLLKEQEESPKIVMSVKASGSGTVIGRCDSLVINR